MTLEIRLCNDCVQETNRLENNYHGRFFNLFRELSVAYDPWFSC